VTDDRTLELLSRFIDGELDAAQRGELERRIAVEPALASELESMQRMRGAVSRLAEGMQPPEDLDVLMRPLRGSVPPRAERGRRGLGWLAAAAAGVIAFALGWELARREPQPDMVAWRQAAATPAEEREPFKLQPLPTSSVPEEERALGAADRLLATPLPSPPIEEPAALEIIGPLESPAVDETKELEIDTEGSGLDTSAALVLMLSDRRLRRQLELAEALPEGVHQLRVTVATGRVVAVQAEGQQPPLSAAIRSSVIGLEVAGVADSEYDAEIRVGGAAAD
jgi:hypothetical protein